VTVAREQCYRHEIDERLDLGRPLTARWPQDLESADLAGVAIERRRQYPPLIAFRDWLAAEIDPSRQDAGTGEVWAN
jgi:hypothetical protein